MGLSYGRTDARIDMVVNLPPRDMMSAKYRWEVRGYKWTKVRFMKRRL